MALTAATARTEVRALLNEETASFWTDTEIDNWIKEGTSDLSTKSLLVTDSQDITLVTNQLTYTSSDHAWIANCLEIIGVYHDDGANEYKGLVRVHPRLLGNTDILDADAPRYYSFHNKTFYFDPIPAAAYNGDTITVLHAKQTDDITDVAYEYQHLIVKYATSMAKVKDRKYHEAQLLLTQYINSINFERADKFEREVDSLDMFMVPRTQRNIPTE